VPPAILVVNAGSSSVKAALFTCEADPRELRRDARAGDPADDAENVAQWLVDFQGDVTLAAIGHRIVHGGPAYDEPTRLDAAVIAGLHAATPFAPNHLPGALRLIAALSSADPRLPQVACFDTSFHRTIPEVARRLPIPARYDRIGVRRYGFHGLSCSHIVEELRRRAPGVIDGRVIIAHLGNGSSITAVRGGRSIDTSMGFTPLGGLMMSTRSGDLDPGVVAFIAAADGLDGAAIDAFFSERSGLRAVAGDTGDMQVLLQRTDAAAGLAVDMYVYQARKWIGAFTAALGGLDTLIFTGGIGEHAVLLRARICAGLEHLGGFRVLVMPANEELVIARATFASLKGLL
jgi:acetate kinase